MAAIPAADRRRIEAKIEAYAANPSAPGHDVVPIANPPARVQASGRRLAGIVRPQGRSDAGAARTAPQGGSPMSTRVRSRPPANSLALELEEMELQRDRLEIMLARIEGANEETIPWEMATRMWDGESRVKVWREHRGLTVRALAEQAGVSASLVSEIETRKKEGSIATLKALAKALRVGLDDIA
jgi:DNA-binding XRE family transcriptional regulator